MNDIFHKPNNWSLLLTPGLVFTHQIFVHQRGNPSSRTQNSFVEQARKGSVCDFLKHIIFMRKKGLPIFLLMNDLVNVT